MKRSDLLIGEQEMFVDPILISDSKKKVMEKSSLQEIFVWKMTLFSRKIFTDKNTTKWNLVAFANTAEYFMDLTITYNKTKSCNKGSSYFENGEKQFFIWMKIMNH